MSDVRQWDVFLVPWSSRSTGRQSPHYVVVVQADSVSRDCATVFVVPMTTSSKAKPGVRATETPVRKRTDNDLQHDSIAMAWQAAAVEKHALDSRRRVGRVSAEAEAGIRLSLARRFGTAPEMPGMAR